LRDQVAAAAVTHTDGTGFRIRGKTRWLPVASTMWLSLRRVSVKRGSLPADVIGIAVLGPLAPPPHAEVIRRRMPG
jgi:transposase